MDAPAKGSEKLVYSIEEAAGLLGIGRNACYEACKEGRLPALRVGKRRLVVPKVALDRLLQASDVRKSA